MNAEMLAGQIRHILGGIGVFLIATNNATPDEVASWTEAGMGLAGAGMTLGAMIWSALAKWSRS